MFEIAHFSFSITELILLVVAALFVGMAKTGVQGVGMIAVPILAIVFGARASTGLLLPLLIFADFFGVYYFHQHADWMYLKRLLPSSLVGVMIGTATGNLISDALFTQVMVVTLALCIGIMIWRETSKDSDIITASWFTVGVGIIGGFTSMVGNLAGPVMALYLLAMQLPKNQFIGTAAWFFLVLNVSKLPFHIWSWKTITLDTFLVDLALLPAIAVGALIGVRIVEKISEERYRWFVIIMVAIAALPLVI